MENIFDFEDVVEVLADLFNLHNFNINYYKGEPFYDPENLTVHIPINMLPHFKIMAFAHEIMYHKQNMDGKLPERDSEEDYDYRVALFLMEQDRGYQYLHAEEPNEIEANNFGILFSKKLFELLAANGFLTANKARRFVSELRKSLIPPSPTADRLEALDKIKFNNAKAYRSLEKEYDKKITDLLSKRLAIPASERTYKIMVS